MDQGDASIGDRIERPLVRGGNGGTLSTKVGVGDVGN